MLSPTERLTTAAEALQQYDASAIELLDTSPDELAKIAADTEIKPADMPKLIGTMIYIKKRLIEKKSRYESFAAAFPERCVVTDTDGSDTFATTKQIGDRLSKSSIDIKAKRLEASPLYNKVYQILQNNLYVMYAVDRLKVLDAALDIALDESTSLRDRDRYMKLFLDETRKDPKLAQLEMNVNITQNNINVVDIEKKLNDVADRLEGRSAAEIIEITHDS